MEPGAVVEALDVIEERGAGLGVGGALAVVDGLVLQAAPKRLDEGVVVAVALAAHRGNEAVVGEDLAVRGAGKLGAAVGVHDQARRRPPPGDRHGQSRDRHGGVEDRAHGPA